MLSESRPLPFGPFASLSISLHLLALPLLLLFHHFILHALLFFAPLLVRHCSCCLRLAADSSLLCVWPFRVRASSRAPLEFSSIVRDAHVLRALTNLYACFGIAPVSFRISGECRVSKSGKSVLWVRLSIFNVDWDRYCGEFEFVRNFSISWLVEILRT